MKIVYFISILIVLSVSVYSSQTKSKTKIHQKLQTKHEKVKQLPIKEIMRMIYKDKKSIEEEDKSIKKAEDIFKSKADGRDESEKALATGEVQLRIIYKFAGPYDDNRQDLEKLPYIFNNKMLYFMESGNESYRGVNSGIDLASIIGKDDDPMNGQCCERMEKIQHVKIEIYEFQGYCFHLDMQTEDYLFCDERQDKITKFREQLVAYAMNAYFVKLGIDAPNFVQDQGLACLNPEFDWSLSNQASWPCECQKGLKQSPLQLQIDMSTLKESDRLKFEFKDATAVRYGVVRREPEFYGEFGMFSHISPTKKLEYNIEKIAFKVPKSEHLILDLDSMQQVKGELLIYGTGRNMEKAILSILFETGEDEGRTNDFMNDMNLDSWKYDNFNEMDENGLPVLKCLKFNEKPRQDKDPIIEYYYPNLKNFLRSAIMLSEQYSFFWYKGSDTKPPCTQNVMRYVMQYPAKMDLATFEKLKTKVITDGLIIDNSKSNIRTIQDRLARDIFYHNANHCGEEPKKREVEPNVDYKFIKATQKISTYAMADNKFPVKDVFMYHGKKDNQDVIDVNPMLKLTKYQKQPFKKEAGEENIEVLKDRWLNEYGPFPEPVVDIVDDTLKKAVGEAIGKNMGDEGKGEKKDDVKSRRLRKYALNK